LTATTWGTSSTASSTSGSWTKGFDQFGRIFANRAIV
jgi:hypothetical protein